MIAVDNSDIENCSFTILGAGRSGVALSKFLAGKGFKVFLSDKNSGEKLKYLDPVALKSCGVEYETGGHTYRIYEQDIIVKSPGVKPEENEIVRAKQSSKKILSEIEIAFRFTPCPVIAITGTNGKTTTAVAIGEILKKAGKEVKVCGNVGDAFSNILDELSEDSIVVLEVSSYQLNDIEKFKPRIAVFLNFAKDHLEWHGSMENYFNAKMRIAENQDEKDLFVFNADDKYIVSNICKINSTQAAFGLNKIESDVLKYKAFLDNDNLMLQTENSIPVKIMTTQEIKLKGLHNVQNFLAAIISAKEVGVGNEVIHNVLSEFKGVEHRIEFVCEINGIAFYNDSKATNIDSMLVAVKSFEKVILILGGMKEHVSFDHAIHELKQRVLKIITFGENKDYLYEIFANVIPVEVADDLETAVDIALKFSVNKPPVLFSPSFKSFDKYSDFEERGRHFKSIVRSKLKGTGSAN